MRVSSAQEGVELPPQYRCLLEPELGSGILGTGRKKTSLLLFRFLQLSLGSLKRKNIQVCPDGRLSKLI